MIEKTYSVDLTYEELLFLDKKCNPKTQEIIDKVIKQMSYSGIPLVGEVIEKSLKLGKFDYTAKRISRCPICGEDPGYYKYKKGRNKGRSDYSRELYIGGIKFNQGCISWKGSGDCCYECDDKYKITKTIISYILENDLKIEMKDGKWIKDDMQICRECNKEMYESEMGRNRTLMGNGTFPSICPYCKAESMIFASHKYSSKFRMIPKKEVKK